MRRSSSLSLFLVLSNWILTRFSAIFTPPQPLDRPRLLKWLPVAAPSRPLSAGPLPPHPRRPDRSPRDAGSRGGLPTAAWTRAAPGAPHDPLAALNTRFWPAEPSGTLR